MKGSCVRGCVQFRRHAADCGDTTCRGCLPRCAVSGLLCYGCHSRLRTMIADAPDVHRWLEANIPGGQLQLRQDWERHAGDTSVRAETLIDQQWVISDRVAAMVEWTCGEFDLTGPREMAIKAMCDFLLAWLSPAGTGPRIEDHPWVEHWWNELAEVTSDSHSLAPWRPELRRCIGIECPECACATLVVYGGDEDVTCQTCRTMIPHQRYDIWTQILADQHGYQTAG
jgi:hypothetical protein